MAEQDPSLIDRYCHQSSEICDCRCHNGVVDVKHVTPCCSECPLCHKNIKMEFINSHVINNCVSAGSGMAVTDGGQEEDDAEK